MAVVNNPSPGGQGGHYDAVTPAGSGTQAAASTNTGDNTSASSDRVTPPEETEAAPAAGDGDGGDNIQLRRYVAEVSASAEAVDQLQRSGNLDLAPVVAEAAQEWARDRDEEDNNEEEEEAVEATEEAPSNGEELASMVSSDCENINVSDNVKDEGDTSEVKLNCSKEDENLQPSQSSSVALSHIEPPCNVTSSPCAETLQQIEPSPETGEEIRESSVQEELTSSDIQV